MQLRAAYTKWCELPSSTTVTMFSSLSESYLRRCNPPREKGRKKEGRKEKKERKRTEERGRNE
ncbi:Pre-mRNA-splicing factor slu7, partial [Ophiophagus hannah]